MRPADKKGRVDLTDVPLVTIDGEDARDFDDAVYCEPAKVGRGKGWRLLVAIADVSHYVQTGSAIDIDAYDRATSVYFPRRVIPMLPEKLSNGLCSLNPEVERLCMVCDMLVAADGEIYAYQFYPAVMWSHARFTYTEVAAILGNTRGPEAAKRKDRVKDLLNLHDVYRALLKARSKRGAVDFETTETQIICDDAGRIEKIVPRTRNEAHRLIEEAMLAANVCSADFIAEGKHPGLYRVHEGPTPEKKEILRGYLKAMGVGLSITDDPKPGEFQAIAEATKERPDAQQIHTMLLRSMQQAIYTPINSGHFGLAYEAYTHFTSPIRRYPDLLVHRVIKAILGKTKYQLPMLPTPGEAHAKLAKRLASRVKAPTHQAAEGHRRAEQGSAGLGSRRPALQRQRAARRRGQPRRRGLAQVQVHARASRRGIRRRGHRGHHLRHLRHARRDVRRGPGAHHRTGRRVLQVRRAAPGTARRAHRHPLCHRHAGAGAGEPRRPRRPQDRLPPGARRRGTERARHEGQGRRVRRRAGQGSAKRSARNKPEAAVERSDRVAAAAPQSAMQAFRSAVKKAANKMKGRKPRR